MTQNRQKGICNKAGFMKGGDHHYSRASCSNCANGPYLPSFSHHPLLFPILSSSNNIMIQSHFCKKKFRGCHSFSVQFLGLSSSLFSILSRFWIAWGSTVTHIANGLVMGLCAEKEVLFAHTRRAALSDNTNCRRPTLLTSPPLCICCQILFHFHTNHLERGSRPHSAGRVLCRPCGLAQLTPYCAITPLNCYLLCCLLLSKCTVTVKGHCVSWD